MCTLVAARQPVNRIRSWQTPGSRHFLDQILAQYLPHWTVPRPSKAEAQARRERPSDASQGREPMETPMSITVVDDTAPLAHNDAHFIGQEKAAREPEKERLTRVRRRTPSVSQRQVRSTQGGIPVVDDRMRIPSFTETCPHICDNIIPLNGGRFNVDHYLRVLRAKAEVDVSIAMALTVRPQ
jgi:hypothetical protein